MANFDPIFNLTLKREGGFQKFANDSANYVNKVLIGTNRGISALAYYNFYKKIPTELDMKNLTQEQAKTIYKKNYWDKINGDKIKNQNVAELMFQFIIGSGASQISDIKDIANTVAGKKLIASNDNKITDAEAEIINQLDQQKYWTYLKEWRNSYFLRIVKANPKLNQFLVGWQKRLNSYTFSADKIISENKNTIGGLLFFFSIGYNWICLSR